MLCAGDGARHARHYRRAERAGRGRDPHTAHAQGALGGALRLHISKFMRFRYVQYETHPLPRWVSLLPHFLTCLHCYITLCAVGRRLFC